MQKEEREQRLEGNGPILGEAYENRPKPWGLTDMGAETQAARLCVGGEHDVGRGKSLGI